MEKNMIERPIIEAVKVKSLLLTVQYVFTANFNDTYWLEEKRIMLDELDKDALRWFDPYNGRNQNGSVQIAIAYCSDDKFTVLQNIDGNITEIETKIPMDCILCENFDEGRLIAVHIRAER